MGKKQNRSSKQTSKNKKTKNTKPRYTPVIALVVLAMFVAGYYLYKMNQERVDAQVTETVKIEMEKGTIVIEIYPELMPITATNFSELVDEGFYDGLVWHRVENWVVQTGDPLGTGMGGSAKTIKLETHKNLKNVRGAVAMARTPDPDSASSQFYVLKSDASWLDGDYAVFGKVTEGMEVIDKLEAGDIMLKVTKVETE